MAITENELLHLKKGVYRYLLLKSPGRFHLIHADAALTEFKFERLLRLYPCDDAQLKKMGLHFSAIRPETLRGVVIRGHRAGDALEFWLGSDVRNYQLDLGYAEEYLSEFFAGRLITHGFAPIWSGLDKALIRKVTWPVNIFSIVCALAFLIFPAPYQLWSILCLLFLFFSIALTLRWPDSFTLADNSRKTIYTFSNYYPNKGKGHLLPGLIAVSFALCARTLLDFSFADFTIGYFMLGIFILSFIVLALHAWYNNGVRSGLINALGIILAVTFLSFGVIGQLNYLLDLHPEQSYVSEVTDKHIVEQPKADDYYCIVKQPDGQTMELTLTQWRYQSVDIGDEISILHYDGAFGIPFYTTSLHTGEQAEVR